jgi:hypothetical protein
MSAWLPVSARQQMVDIGIWLTIGVTSSLFTSPTRPSLQFAHPSNITTYQETMLVEIQNGKVIETYSRGTN